MRTHLRLEIKVPKTDETSAMLEETGLNVLTYDRRWKNYPIRLSEAEAEKHEDLLRKLMQEAYEARL
jgi:hypothetical protein